MGLDTPLQDPLQTRFAKHILGVNRKTINGAVLGELGLQTLQLDMKTNGLKFYEYIHQNQCL